MNYLAIGRLLEDTPAASGDTWSWLVTEVSIFLQVCGGCMDLTKPKMAVTCGTWSIFICTSPNHQTNYSQPQSYGDVLHPQKYSKHGLAHRVTISPTMLMGRLPDSASTARSAATLNRDSSCNNDSFISMQTWGRNTDHHWSSLIIIDHLFLFRGHEWHGSPVSLQHHTDTAWQAWGHSAQKSLPGLCLGYPLRLELGSYASSATDRTCNFWLERAGTIIIPYIMKHC